MCVTLVNPSYGVGLVPCGVAYVPCGVIYECVIFLLGKCMITLCVLLLQEPQKVEYVMMWRDSLAWVVSLACYYVLFCVMYKCPYMDCCMCDDVYCSD